MNAEPSSFRSLRIDIADHVAELTLLGPGKGNAMGPDFWREMPIAMTDLDANADVRAIIVRGSGDHFSYGLDLAGMSGTFGGMMAGPQLAAERLKLLTMVGELQRSFNLVADCKKPVIAAVSGWCIGGGLDLIAACDVRLCSADAKFSLREVKVAMVADLGSLQRLPHVIGEGHTRELALTGKNIDAARALRIGLVNDVYETSAALLDAARALAKEIAENPPLVVQGVKEVMNDAVRGSVRDGLRTVALWNSAFLQSADLTEALTAFAMRRPPKYEGK